MVSNTLASDGSDCGAGLRHGPWPSGAILRSEGGDSVAIIIGQIDVVPAVEQLIAADGVDGEFESSLATDDCLPLKVDGDRMLRVIAGQQFVEVGFRHRCEQEPVLDGVLRE